MLKVAPHSDYPPEDGRYVRGNDASPVAVAIILNHDADKIPPEIEILVRTGIESGVALTTYILLDARFFSAPSCQLGLSGRGQSGQIHYLPLIGYNC